MDLKWRRDSRCKVGVCVNGDGLVAGEGAESGECKGWRWDTQVGVAGLAEGQVCMDGDGISARSGVRMAAGPGVCRWRAHGWRQDSLDYAFLWGGGF